MGLVAELERRGYAWEPLSSEVPGLPIQSARRHRELIAVSGQIAFEDGHVIAGKVGAQLDVSRAAQAARLCAVECLRAAGAVVDNPDDIVGVLKVEVFVNCTPEFTEHSLVANEASDLLLAVLGSAGRHARHAVGVASLPMNAAVEVAMVLVVKE